MWIDADDRFRPEPAGRIYFVDLLPDISCPDGRERAGKPLIILNKATI
jgi:hypothetical protein